MVLSEGMKFDIDGGAISPVRIGKDRSLMVQTTHAIYQDAVKNGKVFTISTALAGVTIAAANVSSAANPQPLVGVFNPTGSGVNLVIWRAWHSWASGTAAAQGLHWAISAPPSTLLTAAGVTTSSINNLTFIASSVARQFVNAAMTGAVLTPLRFLGGPTTGALAANANMSFFEETGGDIIVPPGGICGIFASSAGTSPIVAASFTYEEVPV
jgi:hypothetical protein